MSEYRPPFTITDRILSLVSSVSEKIGHIDAISRPEGRPHLRKNTQIRSIHSSLKIEGSSLSLDQVRDIINGKTVLGEQKEIQEVKNAYAAYEHLPEIDPCSIRQLKELHGIMTQCLISESGRFRSGEEGVFRGGKCIFMAPPARLVPRLMEDLFSWMKASPNTVHPQNKVHPLILGSVFHYEFVFIHPFADGNGRMARLWHTAILTKWKPTFACISVESQIEKFRNAYYAAIAECQTAGESTAFIEFVLAQIDQILSEVCEQDSGQTEYLPERVQRLLTVMECDTPYTGNALMEKLGLKAKEGFRRNYLRPAIEMNVIRMTIPDRPNSRNQRYVRI